MDTDAHTFCSVGHVIVLLFVEDNLVMIVPEKSLLLGCVFKPAICDCCFYRTTSPRRYQPVSVTPSRRDSPAYGNQQRFNAGRRSRSPRQGAHNPVLSPISVGEDEAGDSLEGMWLPQPPATLTSQQGML